MSNLTLRIISAGVLMPLALAATYYGGWAFTLMWAIAAIAVLWEWTRLVKGPVWIVAGFFYAAFLFVAPVWLRADVGYGLLSIFLLFGIVWSTDIFGYFVGRAIGGPKLMPRVSPKKTWSGAIGGTAGAIIVAVVVANVFKLPSLMPIAIIALLLSACAQAGDLFESFIKRKFGVKDSSQLIPGHGGVMDRLDGFWAAALLAFIIGASRGGFSNPASGLLVW
ncbi:MAG: CDP-archaeol synthase [Pseudolabrys sp.]|nr:CDP-archaeol synthase [Pseudolabrys sp.]